LIKTAVKEGIVGQGIIRHVHAFLGANIAMMTFSLTPLCLSSIIRPATDQSSNSSGND
jgi:hypothetical protein